MNHEEEQKNFFCRSQVVLARGLFEGFFWPSEGRRPSEANMSFIFLGEMHQHMNHEEGRKTFFYCSQVVLARGLFEGFF